MPSTLWTHCIIEHLKNYHIRFLSYVPDSIIEQILRLARHDPFFDLLPLAREEEGVGVVTGQYVGGERGALGEGRRTGPWAIDARRLARDPPAGVGLDRDRRRGVRGGRQRDERKRGQDQEVP